MRKKIASLLLSIITSVSHADLLGVEDAQMIIIALKQLRELQNQYRVLSDTYKTAKRQVDTLKDLKSMHSGHYGFGNVGNGSDALQNWQSPVSMWQDALHNLSGGNPARYQALIAAYEKNHPSLNEGHYAHVAPLNQVARFKEDKAVNKAVLVQTTESYNAINTHMKALHQLSLQIEKTPNTKGAVDLNSRLIAELGFIQLMSLRLQSLISQQAAQESLSELQDRAEMAQFNAVQ